VMEDGETMGLWETMAEDQIHSFKISPRNLYCV